MNKWQIICPLAAMGVAVALILVRSGGLHPKTRAYTNYITSRTEEIGRDLIAKTNSTHVDAIAPAVRKRLLQFLANPAHVAQVLMGDEPPPIGDGQACSRLILTNSAGNALGIRLSQRRGEPELHILGWWEVPSK